MFPNFNAFPNFPSQIQPNPTNTPNPNPLPHQDVSSNPNSMQIQPQMGMFSHTPGTNPNIPMSGVLNSGFMNGPNNNLLNFPLGMQQLSQLASLLCNLRQNSYPMNSFQQNSQLFQHNLLQQLGNVNAALPNFNYALQNLNQLLPGASVFNQYNGVPNPMLLANSQVGMLQQMNQIQHNLVQQAMGADGLRPPGGLNQHPGESSVAPEMQHQSSYPERSQKFGNAQENLINRERITTPSPHSKSFHKKGLHKASPGDASRMGSRKPHFQHMKNGKRKFEFNNGHEGRVNGREAKGHNQPKECKRSLAITYTEQEIQKWRAERRKNYPSKANILKKQDSGTKYADAKLRREQLKDILTKQAELGVEVAEIPSHYLAASENKDHFMEQNKRPFSEKDRFQNRNNKRGRHNRRECLADSGNKDHFMEQNKRPFSEKDRFQNRNNKRGRHNRRERCNKKQRPEVASTSNVPPSSKNKETLLQKLLSKDVKRDKCHLLQAFRFMVMNSFFDHMPDQPLKFPTVIVKEAGFDGEVIEEKALIDTKVLGGGSKDQIESNGRCGNDNDSNHGDGENTYNDSGTDLQYCHFGKDSYVRESNGRPQAEEGEIID